MFKGNQLLFQKIKNLKLPMGQYAITGSGPLGIRELRAMGDIDIIVDSELWDSLAIKFGVTEEKNVKKIVIPEANIEVMGAISFNHIEKDIHDPNIEDRIKQADIIDDLPFEALKYVIYFKQKMGREKDLQDIALIETWLKNQ